eukprot:scaffold77050_cov44-Cyclotella_meneghiniana.AAC.8
MACPGRMQIAVNIFVRAARGGGGFCREITLAADGDFLAYRDPCTGQIGKYGEGGSTRGCHNRWMCNRAISFVVRHARAVSPPAVISVDVEVKVRHARAVSPHP